MPPSLTLIWERLWIWPNSLPPLNVRAGTVVAQILAFREAQGTVRPGPELAIGFLGYG